MNAIAIVIVTTIFLALIILLVDAALTIYDQDKAKKFLRGCNSKLSNALRQKGIEVDQLEKKIERLKRGKNV